MRDFGKTYKSQCNEPEYKDGLCKRHYNNSIKKQLNWINRDTYRPATIEDILQGRSLKLRNSNQNNLFMLRKGVIKQETKKHPYRWIDTNYAVDPNLFCVLNF